MPMPVHCSNDASASNNVPAFLSKLWRLVDDPMYDEFISWNESGQSFIIHDQGRFSKDVLPLYFKHNNMASFIRQLNMYGFRKVVNVNSGGLKGGKEDIEFYHNFFVRDQEAMLEFIKRKASAHPRTSGGNTMTCNPKNSPGMSFPSGAHAFEDLRNELVRELLTDVNQLHDKQERVDSELMNIKRENEALWREVALLRRKHLKQQQIVEKLIRFLVALVHRHGGSATASSPAPDLPVKREHALMIDDGGGSLHHSKRRYKATVGVERQGMTGNTSLVELESDGPIISDVTYDPASPQSAFRCSDCGSSAVSNVNKAVIVGRGALITPAVASRADRLLEQHSGDKFLCSETGQLAYGVSRTSDKKADSVGSGTAVVVSAPLSSTKNNKRGILLLPPPLQGANGLASTRDAVIQHVDDNSVFKVSVENAADTATAPSAAVEDSVLCDDLFAGDVLPVEEAEEIGESVQVSEALISDSAQTLKKTNDQTCRGKLAFKNLPTALVSNKPGSKVEDLLPIDFHVVQASGKRTPPLSSYERSGQSSVLNTPNATWGGEDAEAGPSKLLDSDLNHEICTSSTTCKPTAGSELALTMAIPKRQNALVPATSVSPAACSTGSMEKSSGCNQLRNKKTDALAEQLESMDKDLEWIQDQFFSGGLNIDSSALLGLFNSDDLLHFSEEPVNGGSILRSGGNTASSQVVSYQGLPSLDLISSDENDDERTSCNSQEKRGIK